MAFLIVGKKFTVDEFDRYCEGEVFKKGNTPLSRPSRQSWVKRIVLHNTATPSLAMREGGILTPSHILNLQAYYANKKWTGGPHLFVDATGVWVFNPLNDQGTHSPSYNNSSWGVEMLGDYERESFDTGLGANVRDNSVRAIAALARLQGWGSISGKLILHKEDPQTDHDCPGKNVDKADVIARVDEALSPLQVFVNGKSIGSALLISGKTYLPLRITAEALGAEVVYDAKANRVNVTQKTPSR